MCFPFVFFSGFTEFLVSTLCILDKESFKSWCLKKVKSINYKDQNIKIKEGLIGPLLNLFVVQTLILSLAVLWKQEAMAHRVLKWC